MSEVSVTFSAHHQQLIDSIGKIQASIDSMGEKVKTVEEHTSNSFANMAKAGLKAAAGFEGFHLAVEGVKKVMEEFGAAIDMGAHLTSLSARTGETAGNLLLLERAFEGTKVGADKVGPALSKMQQFLFDAREAGSAAERKLKDLNLTLSDFDGKGQVASFGVLSHAIAGFGDAQDRAKAAATIFGNKIGTSLLPILMTYSESMDVAKGHTGSLARIMDASAVGFQHISENANAAKEKMLEFAAGIFSVLSPAIEAVSHALANFDAAGLGERIAKAFVGGTEAMNGFKSAIEAMKAGNLGDAFSIAFASIKLQAVQTINETYRMAVAMFAALGEALKTTMGPGSPLFNMFSMMIDLLVLKIEKSMSLLPNSIRDDTIEKTKSAISESAGMIGGSVVNAAKQFPKNFEKNYPYIDPLIKDEPYVDDLTKKSKGYAPKDDSAEATEAFTRSQNEKKTAAKNALEQAKQLAKDNADKMEEFKRSLHKAEAGGEDEEVNIIRAEMEYQRVLNKLKKDGVAEDEASSGAQESSLALLDDLTAKLSEKNDKAAAAADKEQAAAEKKRSMSEIQAKLDALNEQDRINAIAKKEAAETASFKMLKAMTAAQDAKAIDPGGRLQATFNRQMAHGSVKAAAATQQRMEEAEKAAGEKFDRGMGREKDTRSIQDIARDEGLETAGKTKSQLEKELSAGQRDTKKEASEMGIKTHHRTMEQLKRDIADAKNHQKEKADLEQQKLDANDIAKRKDELKPGRHGKTKSEVAKENETSSTNKPERVESLESLVKSILSLVAKIEPKLPIMAMGI